ncbi:MAG: AMP-binding protein, partial [Burkholderiaceae bacterium]
MDTLAANRNRAIEHELLAIVEATLRDLRPDAPLPQVTLAASLDRDLAFDSLGRMELLLRVEREFGVDLPEETLASAETVGALLDAVLAAQGRAAPRRERAVAAAEAQPAAAPVAEPGEPAAAHTLLDVLDWHLVAHAERTQVTYLADDAVAPISFRRLADGAAAIAAGLQRAGVEPRQCVAIMLPTSPEYFDVYLGILLAGGIPVPIYPPARASQLEEHVLRHAGILANAQAAILVTVPEAKVVARLLQARVPGLRRVVTPQALAERGGAFTPVAVRADDIALIQYTSGSTGSPKGVALTHANLLANIRAMARTLEASPRDVFVSWLPLYHDMGLIGAFLGTLYVGCPLVVMSPLAFLSKPSRWLRAIHDWRGTLSAGPNFAWELCVKRIDDAELAGLDLSSWRLAFNGAEAVNPDTLARFAQRFARCGFNPEAITPVYGLAEASVGLLFPPLLRGPLVDRVQRDAFTRSGRALPAAADDATALRFVSCGRPLPGHAIRIVDDADREVAERIEGHLQFRGPSATQGYFRNPRETARLFRDGWLDTGDRAYVAAGEVYVTGRVKDIIIRGGRNLYPEEIENAVGAVEGVRKGCVAAFGAPDPQRGTERLVVLAEVRAADARERARLHAAIARAVLDAIGEPPDEVVLAPPHAVLKTSSGKIRRAACRALYEQGRLNAPARALRWQVLRLALGAAALRLRQAISALGAAGFGLRAMTAFGLIAPPVWLLTLFARAPAAAWKIGRTGARLLFRLAGVPLAVRGIERLPAGPCVLVANHASYVDGIVLVAALPRPYAFVAKRELQAQRIAGTCLARLGAEFVERFDVKRSVEDANRMAEAVRQGRSLLVFPEGTFVERPGLLPFRLGAFLAAASA